jgi:hypothetical protein
VHLKLYWPLYSKIQARTLYERRESSDAKGRIYEEFFSSSLSYEVRYFDYKVRYSEFEVRYSEFKVRYSEFKVRYSKFKVRYSKSEFCHMPLTKETKQNLSGAPNRTTKI